MGMREKLIELIQFAVSGCATYWAGLIADHLIANGVTIPVRCKDCERWQRHTHVDRERGHCRRFDLTKHESGFCDRGERKGDGNDNDT